MQFNNTSSACSLFRTIKPWSTLVLQHPPTVKTIGYATCSIKNMATKCYPPKLGGTFRSLQMIKFLQKICYSAHILVSHSLLNPICSQLTCLFLGNVHPPQFLSTDYHPTLVISILDYHSLAACLSPHSKTPTG